MIYHFIMGWLILTEIVALGFIRIAEIEQKREQEQNDATRLWLFLHEH